MIPGELHIGSLVENYLKASVVVDLYETLQQIRHYISQNSFKKSFGAALFATLDALLSTWAISSLRKNTEFFQTFPAGFIVESTLIYVGNLCIREPLIDLVYKKLKSVSGEKNIDQSKRVDAGIQTLRTKEARSGIMFTSIFMLSASMLRYTLGWIRLSKSNFYKKFCFVDRTGFVRFSEQAAASPGQLDGEFSLSANVRQSFLATVVFLPLLRRHFQLQEFPEALGPPLRVMEKPLKS